MAFDSLSEKLQNVFKNLRGKGRLTEADVKAALKEVKLALLEADVSFKVVKQFIKAVEARAAAADHIMYALSADAKTGCHFTERIVVEDHILIYLLLMFCQQFAIKIIQKRLLQNLFHYNHLAYLT